MTKSAPFELLQKHILHVQEFIDATSLSQHLQGSSIVRKLRIKAVSRIATRLLPVRQVTRKLNGELFIFRYSFCLLIHRTKSIGAGCDCAGCTNRNQ